MELGCLQDLIESNFIIIVHTRLRTGKENKRVKYNLIKKDFWGIICKVQQV